jgi:Tfp pilus assembly protein PilZ
VDSTSDQRENTRLKFEAVLWHNNILPGVLYKAKICNLSKGGVYFETDQSLYPGEKIHIAKISLSSRSDDKNVNRVEIKWRDDNAKYFDRIEIKWRKELKDSSFRFGYGAIFTNSESKLAKLIIAASSGKQIISSEDWDYRKDPRELTRENYRKEIIFSSKKQNYKGFISNISRVGAFIETKNKFSLGQIVNLEIPGDSLFKELNLIGCVVRLDPDGVGIKFDKRSGRERRKAIDRRTGADRRSRRKLKGKARDK